jgi:hypothetical protein
MAEEKKTVLIEIKSNLQTYIDQLIEAKKKLADAKLAVDDLSKGTLKSQDVIEKTNAAYRQAKSDVTNATKAVDLATKANKAQVGSYEELYRSWQLAQTQLKLTGGLYTKNAQGVMELNANYQKQKVVVDNAKKSLDAFGKGIHDNRLNVGNYSEAFRGLGQSLSSIPGPVGNVASSLSHAGNDAKGLVSNLGKAGPVAMGVMTAIAAISAPLIAFFTKSEKGVELLEVRISGFKAAIGVLVQDLIGMGDKMTSNLQENQTKISTFWTTIGQIFGGTGERGMRMDLASMQAREYTRSLQLLEDQEIAMIKPRAEANLKLKEARLLFADETLSIDKRLNALRESIKQENIISDMEVKHQQAMVEEMQKNKLIQGNKWRDEDERALQTALAKIEELKSESAGRQIRIATRLSNEEAKLLKDLYDQWEKEAELAIKKFNDWSKRITSLTQEDQLLKAPKRDRALNELALKYAEDMNAARDSQVEMDLLTSIYRAKQKELLEKQVQEENAIRFEAQRLQIDNEKRTEIERINRQIAIAEEEWNLMKETVDFKSMTDNQKLLAEEKYTNNMMRLAAARNGIILSELTMMGNAMGELQSIFSENTEAYKFFGIAQATIGMLTAAAQAMADWSSMTVYQKIANAATIIAQGAALISQIKGVDTSGVSSSPRVITSSPAAKRVTAQPANGGTILTQPSISQSQTGALAAQGMLTAKDIAAEIAKLPAPVVTVEDINARSKSVIRVTERANI